MSEWKKYKLGDIIEVKHGFAFRGEFISDIPTNNILVTPGNFNIGGGFKQQKFKYYAGNYPESYVLKEGDVIVTMTDLSQETDTLGYSAKIPKQDGIRFLHNQRIGLVNFISDEVDKDFIYWLMRTSDYQGFIIGSSSGTSIMHTSPSRVTEYSFLLPPLCEQRMIANTLSSLDDKINLLQRQNKTLEQLAETLFRQWFVEEADEENIELGEVIKTSSGGTPSRSKMEYYSGTIKWVKSKELQGGFIFETEEMITHEAVKNSSAKLLPANTILIAMYGATVGEYGILAEPATCNQAICALIPNENYPYSFLFILTKFNKENLINMAVGSAQQNISQELIRQLGIPKSRKKIRNFHEETEPMFQKIKANTIQIKTLITLRDTLLPKIMSGGVRVIN